MNKDYGIMKNGTPARYASAVGGTNVQMANKNMMKLFGLSLLAVVMFSVGVYVGREFDVDLGGLTSGLSKVSFTGDTTGENLEEVDFNHYWEVWDTLRGNYVDSDKVSEQDMLDGSIKGFVDAFDDPATLYLDAEETAAYNDSRSGNYFSGIGAELGYKDGQIVVIAPIKGSPALAAGIKSGDVILAVDGEDITSDMTIYDVVLDIRGEEGTEVVLTVFSNGDSETRDVSITRGQITIPSMEFVISEDNQKIAIFDVARFTEASLTEWQEKWDELVDMYLDSDADGIIIDLRGNPGGFLNGAVYAANDFLEKGDVVAQTEDRNGDIDSFTVTREGRLIDVPVVLLVNEGTASASEILAGALQKNDRAEVVGINTYGKGTAQTVVDFKDGSSLHVTIMKWLLPDGTWLNHDNTITPDYDIEFTDEQFKAGEDPQMDKAVQLVESAIN